jgi:hypothetical protein
VSALRKLELNLGPSFSTAILNFLALTFTTPALTFFGAPFDEILRFL